MNEGGTAGPRIRPAWPGLRTTGLVLLMAGLAVYIAGFRVAGTGDAADFRTWATNALRDGLLASYAPSDTRAVADYPPLSVAVISALGWCARALGLAIGRDAVGLGALIKVPGLLLGLASCAWLAGQGRRAPADPAVRTDLSAWGFWLNPALLIAGPLLGYIDSWCWFPSLAALIAASAGRSVLAGVLAGVAVMMKPQGAFVAIPLAAALWLKPRELGRAFVASLVVVAVCTAPFALATPEAFAARMRRNFTQGNLSGNALNVWWLAGGAGQIDRLGAGFATEPLNLVSTNRLADAIGFDPTRWMAAAVLAAAVLAAWRVRGVTSVWRHAALYALIVHVYFVLAVNVHENHIIYAVPALAMAAAVNRSYRALCVCTSAFACANLTLFYGLTGTDLAPSGLVTCAVALAGLILIAYHIRTFQVEAGRPHTPGAAW